MMEYSSEKSTPNQQPDEGLALGMKIFYEEDADTTVRLMDDRTLKFNKAMLISTTRSEVLYQIFYGDLKVEETKIDDIDYDTFKLFLNCAMRYERYNFENCYKIFPVVHKYQIGHMIGQCIKFLLPKIMDENVCHLLNLAVFYTCDKLIQKTHNFIVFNNVYKFLETERYCHLLGPDSLKLILSNQLIIDSHLLMVLTRWGKNYIEKNSLNSITLNEFLRKQDLFKFFKLECFETTGAISEFCFSEEGKDIFSFDEVLFHIHNSEDLIHGRSKWVKMEKGSRFSEQIVVTASGNNHSTSVKIERNKAVFYKEKFRQKKTEQDEELITCNIRFFAFDTSGSEFDIDETEIQFSQIDLEKKLIDFVFSYDFNCGRNRQKLSRFTFEITWTFLEECRVLLTNRPGDKLNDPEKKYFTKKIAPCF